MAAHDPLPQELAHVPNLRQHPGRTSAGTAQHASGFSACRLLRRISESPWLAVEKLFATHNVPFGPQPSQGSYQPKLAALRIAEKVPANFGQLGKLKAFKRFGRALTAPC